jgi:hypothetical protein
MVQRAGFRPTCNIPITTIHIIGVPRYQTNLSWTMGFEPTFTITSCRIYTRLHQHFQVYLNFFFFIILNALINFFLTLILILGPLVPNSNGVILSITYLTQYQET